MSTADRLLLTLNPDHWTAEDFGMGQVAAAQQPRGDLSDSTVEPTREQLERVVAASVELAVADVELDEVGGLLSLLACAVSGVDGSVVEILDGPDLVYGRGVGLLAGAEGLRVPREGSLSGFVTALAKPIVCGDTWADERVNRDLTDRLGIRSMAVMPLRHAHHTYGVLKVACSEPYAVTAFVLDLLEPVVRVAAARWARVSAAEVSRQQVKRLTAVTELGKQVLLSRNPAGQLLDAMTEASGARYAMLFLPDGDELVLHEERGTGLRDLRLPLSHPSAAVTAFRTGRPKVLTDWISNAAVAPVVRDQLISMGLDRARSAAYIPLDTHDGPVGVVAILLDEPIRATNADLLGLLQLLAAEAGVAITRDVLLRRLSDQARTDPLTDLANRRAWQERSEMEVVRAVRTGSPLAVLMLDLDRFKSFNDEHGHPSGDALLAGAADAWSDLIRPTDLLARLGGEEFGLLLPDTDGDAAGEIADRLRGAVPQGQTVSIGMTLFAAGEAVGDTVARADAALYDAKTGGRNRVCSR